MVKLWLGIIMALSGTVALAQNTPKVSANALFWFRQSNFAEEDQSTVRNGADIQELEVAFFADVDPYSRLFVILGLHPEYEFNATDNKVEESWLPEPEEAYGESNHIPMTTLKFGKFKAAFGKHNLLHTHAFHFVDAPVANTELLGEEGLNDKGLSAAILWPTPWFLETTFQYLRAEGGNEEFNSPSPNDGVGLARLKNLWDLTSDLTLEAGASYAEGKNSFGGNTSLLGADLTFKWRPASDGKYKSWIAAAEFIERNLEQPRSPTEKGQGYNLWAQYQFAERWSTAVRYDHLEIEDSSSLRNGGTEKRTVALNFYATEFSSFRAEYSRTDGPVSTGGDTREDRFFLQANLTIGAHPSHAY